MAHAVHAINVRGKKEDPIVAHAYAEFRRDKEDLLYLGIAIPKRPAKAAGGAGSNSATNRGAIVPPAVIPLLSALAVCITSHCRWYTIAHRIWCRIPTDYPSGFRSSANPPTRVPQAQSRTPRQPECPGSRDSRLLQYAALSADKAWLSELYDAGREPEKRFMDVVRIQSAMEPAKGGDLSNSIVHASFPRICASVDCIKLCT